MEINAYLDRINYQGSLTPTVETLRQLHRAHMFCVPFENLDVHLGNPIILSLENIYDKIVRRRRGGFCYELNSLFGWLLEQLGFTVTLLSARVFNSTEPGAEFDHLLLLIELEKHLLADVGFGDSFLEALWLDTNKESIQHGIAYRLIDSETEKVLQRRSDSSQNDADWHPQYIFSLTPHQLTDFSGMCHYHQTSPQSYFASKTVCSRPTTTGRVTLSNHRLITTTAGQRQEQDIQNPQEYRRLLKLHFGIDLGTEAQIDKLMFPSNVGERN